MRGANGMTLYEGQRQYQDWLAAGSPDQIMMRRGESVQGATFDPNWKPFVVLPFEFYVTHEKSDQPDDKPPGLN